MVSFSKNLMVSVAGIFALMSSVSASSVGGYNEAYVCSFCVIISGLIEQAAVQLNLQPYLESKCESSACQLAVKVFVNKLLSKAVPEELCAEVGLCTQGCTLFSEWPLKHVPDAQPAWPTARRALAEREADLTLLAPIFRNMVGTKNDFDSDLPLMAHMAFAMAEVSGTVGENACGHNVSCKIKAFADQHVPLQDRDGDRFSLPEFKRLRGSHWRGYDCDDKRDDVYPGRRSTSHDASVDHNCNGISGGNSTGSYEELFCANSEPRGLIMLGDSATAHFHIPPQWITADGWDMDQLVPTALNELDFPMCSWGTGHVTPEECPYQTPVLGVEGVVSIYTMMRNRNRCNHNDFQNIGVNGARVTSSMKLVNAMARDPKADHPALVWFSLIGNDVCNGHPGFDHMTDPEDFYTHALESLRAIDATVPKGSHVVALALFDGELLYDIMARHQHPVGARYADMYDFMNCLEENPCWGWLNTNQTVRRKTTQWSNSLNRVYHNISRTAQFDNFEFIFYSPNWVQLFNDYQAAGNALVDLIEKADGFHPSQAGNALFATQFFQWLEAEHPEALGPVNPHNAEIDALFFNQQQQQQQQAAKQQQQGKTPVMV